MADRWTVLRLVWTQQRDAAASEQARAAAALRAARDTVEAHTQELDGEMHAPREATSDASSWLETMAERGARLHAVLNEAGEREAAERAQLIAAERRLAALDEILALQRARLERKRAREAQRLLDDFRRA